MIDSKLQKVIDEVDANDEVWDSKVEKDLEKEKKISGFTKLKPY